MAQYFSIHPQNPQPRLINQACAIIKRGGVVAYPTDSSYALGCAIGNKQAMERIRKIRQLSDAHNFTLVCSDLSTISLYAKLDNHAYRLLKALTPGPYTFIFTATGEVPRRLQHPKRRTIGIRVPDFAIVQHLLAELGEPIMSVTLILPGATLPEHDPMNIREALEHKADLVIDGGTGDIEPTTVVDLSGEDVEIKRVGKGDTTAFEPK